MSDLLRSTDHSARNLKREPFHNLSGNLSQQKNVINDGWKSISTMNDDLTVGCLPCPPIHLSSLPKINTSLFSNIQHPMIPQQNINQMNNNNNDNNNNNKNHLRNNVLGLPSVPSSSGHNNNNQLSNRPFIPLLPPNIAPMNQVLGMPPPLLDAKIENNGFPLPGLKNFLPHFLNLQRTRGMPFPMFPFHTLGSGLKSIKKKYRSKRAKGKVNIDTKTGRKLITAITCVACFKAKKKCIYSSRNAPSCNYCMNRRIPCEKRLDRRCQQIWHASGRQARFPRLREEDEMENGEMCSEKIFHLKNGNTVQAEPIGQDDLEINMNNQESIHMNSNRSTNNVNVYNETISTIKRQRKFQEYKKKKIKKIVKIGTKHNIDQLESNILGFQDLLATE